jgi:hypothetical protein
VDTTEWGCAGGVHVAAQSVRGRRYAGRGGGLAGGVAFKVRAAEHEQIKCMAGWAKRATFCSIDMHGCTRGQYVIVPG